MKLLKKLQHFQEIFFIDIFRRGTHLYMSLFPSVRRAAYLRNRTSSDHSFWHKYVKWWYLQPFFSFFQNFDSLIVKGLKGQKMAQNEKQQLHLSCIISQEQIAYGYDFWYTCVKWWYFQLFFSFFFILIFWAVQGVKGQKMVQNEK